MLSKLQAKIQHSDIAKRMLSGAFWAFTGTALGKFIILTGGIFCAHILGKDAYGELGMVRSTISMVVLSVAGLGLAATKFISEYKKEKPERIPSIYLVTNGSALATSILASISILLAAPWLAGTVLQTPNLTIAIRIGALLLFAAILNGAQTGTLSGLENFRAIAFNTLIGSIAETAGLILGSWYWGVTGGILGYGVGFLVLYFANYYAICRSFHLRGIKVDYSSLHLPDLKILYSFCLPATLSSIIVMPVIWIVRAMLVREEGFGEAAVYDVADQWRMIILFVPSAVSQIVLPILSSLSGRGSKTYQKVLLTNIALNSLTALLMAIVVSFCGNYIMGLYGKDFTNDTPLILLAISTVFSAISYVAGGAIASRAKMWTGFLFNLIWSIMLIAFSYFFLQQGMGALGIALAFLLSYLIHATMQMLYLFILNRSITYQT